MTKAYKVSSRITMPTNTGRGRAAIYKFPELEIGQSFLVTTIQEVNAARNRYYRVDQKIIVRTESDGSYRIWRRT